MKTATLDRKQFLQSGAIAAALAAAGRLPLLAAADQAGAGLDARTGPHAVKPIRSYLPRFSPAGGTLRDRRDYSLSYDILHWGGAQWAAGKPTVTPIGKIAIRRSVTGEGRRFEIRQETTIGGVENVIEAEIRCLADDLAPVREWKFRSYSTKTRGGIDPLSELKETGAVRDGKVRVDSGNHRFEFSSRNSVVTQWTILDSLIGKATPAWKATVDLLQDLSLFKPNQSLVYDGEARLTLKDGETVTLQTYAQTGEGILPVHYLLDGERRPQLVTSSILSWALTGVK